MSLSFPTSAKDFANSILVSHPEVYQILRDAYFDEVGDGSAPPTPNEIIEQLIDYDGLDNDTNVWKGRWHAINNLTAPVDPIDTVGRENIGRFLNDMTRIHYGYILTRCPRCDAINRQLNTDDGEKVLECDGCGCLITHNESPDLFF